MFQGSAFQRSGFQIAGYGAAPSLTPNGGGRHREYQPTYYELENHRRKLKAYKDSERETELELKSVEYKIEDLEFRRLRDLADETMQLQLIALIKEQQILTMLLKELQMKKEQWRKEEDDILILLMSQPFFA
jgi:hypothetical protein